MPQHREIRIVPYTADQMFAVVADIERYPEFLPWCAGLRILKREKDGAVDVLTAEMKVAYHGISEPYTSRVRSDPSARTIEAVHVEGPFKRLDTQWRFEPTGQGSEVHFFIDFAFKSVVLSTLASVAFGMVASRMAESFITRARTLYGSKVAPATGV